MSLLFPPPLSVQEPAIRGDAVSIIKKTSTILFKYFVVYTLTRKLFVFLFFSFSSCFGCYTHTPTQMKSALKKITNGKELVVICKC